MKRSFLLGIASLLLIAIVLPTPQSAYAKMGLHVEDQANEWGDFESPFETNHATPFTGYFGRLSVYGDVDVLAFDFEESSTNWGMDIAVPQCGVHFEPFYPTMALIGPGLELSEDDVLPFDLPDDVGAIVLSEAEIEQPRPIGTYGLFEYDFYENVFSYEDIPQAGRYYVAIWEPNGHVGAYALQTGNSHPEVDASDMEAMEAGFARISSGEWIGVNCDEPTTIDTCPITPGPSVDSLPVVAQEPLASGEYSLTGIVRDATTCLPIPNAQLVAEIVNTISDSNPDFQTALTTNQQGGYRFDSHRSENSGSMVRITVMANGYVGIVATHFISTNEDWGELSINLRPN